MSIAVACPNCDAKLNVRDDMAGRRGKCPKCNRSIDIPSADVATKPAATVTFSGGEAMNTEQIAAVIREALPALNIRSPAKAGSVGMIANLSKGLHYLAPVVFVGGVAYHLAMHGSWASGASGTPGPMVYYVLLGVLGLLAAMSICSHLAPPPAKVPAGLPMDEKTAPQLSQAIQELSERLEVPQPPVEFYWNGVLEESQGTLRVGASALGNMSVSEVLGALVRELAVQRSPGRRAARAEFERLRRALGEREPGDNLSPATKFMAGVSMLGRPIVWPLMVMVRSVCEPELRKAELEADAIACELVGSRAWLSTIQRRRLVEYAAELAAADLPYQFQDKSLRANRVQTVEENLQTLPDEVKQSILETPVDNPRAGDYRPTWQERITAAQALGHKGTLKCAAAGRFLVESFDQLCRDVTWLDSSRRFGKTLQRRELKS